MFSSINTVSLNGMDARIVHAEADISDGGLPVFEMVGFLAGEVKESKERIKTALKNSDFLIPPKRITVNLSPADMKKSGSAFDLPVAISLITSMGLIPPESLETVCMAGELSLSGEVTRINGILPMVMEARDKGFSCFLVPFANRDEGGAASGIRVIGVRTLKEAVEYLRGDIDLPPSSVSVSELLKKHESYDSDFSLIMGQKMLKRGIEVAVAGMHNILMIGPPGSGKTMAAKCIPTILPPLREDECLEISRIYSIAGSLGPEGLVLSRPFVSPHHTITAQALAGGGSTPRPGSISMSHRGVLFLDELPEFNRSALEILRQPMEDRVIHISRASGSFTFPADFLFAAAMNPCKCGYYPDRNRCSCTEPEIRKYLSKISQPLIDRIDICVEASEIDFEDLQQKSEHNESSEEIRARVTDCVEIQKKRYSGTPIRFNADLKPKDLKKYCSIGPKEEQLLRSAFSSLGLSARAYSRVLKCARTIADLDHADQIQSTHLSEAIAYRSIDRRYWNGGK